jgi:hypothetical protein
MRTLLALLFIAGCATTPGPSPADRVAGCWISRDEAGATTMRWFADTDRPGALRGDKLTYVSGAAGQAERYSLAPRGGGWALCAMESAGERCWQVAEGQEGSLEGGRAFIDAHHDDLRISIMGDGAERVVFDGARDGCD